MTVARPRIALDETMFRPGMRLAVGLSGGADSVALLRALHDRSREIGLVLQIAHLHHGLRGAEADADRDFCRALAEALALPFYESRVDTAAAARPDSSLGKPPETIEEAARRLRYAWFRELMGSGAVEAVATAHTLDDQAETVLAKFLRGAWTGGLSGIYPVVRFPEGRILRPLLNTMRSEIEAYLRELGQTWREDSSNRHLAFTRNRIRHELLPLLESWNPRLRQHLVQMADLAREEGDWWEPEVERIAAQIVLPGRPVRGGGRAAGEVVAIDVARLAELSVALQRRVLRKAAGRLGSAPDFEATEALRILALTGRAGQKCELAGLSGERTHRELRLSPGVTAAGCSEAAGERIFEIPGEIDAAEWGIRVRVQVRDANHKNPASGSEAPPRFSPDTSAAEDRTPLQNLRFERLKAVLRRWKPGDRVRLRHSGGPRKVKEVLERIHVSGSARANWPVLEIDGGIVWMQGVQLEPQPGIEISVTTLTDSGSSR
ncbi:MAG TPA: tRNA lysidine(34) synthetase TilS [Terracidiphilus sp.]